MRPFLPFTIVIAFVVMLSVATPAQAQFVGPLPVHDTLANIHISTELANDIKTFAELYTIAHDAQTYYDEWRYQLVQMKDIGAFAGHYADSMLVGIGQQQLNHDIDSLGKDAQTTIAILNGGPIGLLNDGYSGLVDNLSKPPTDGGVLYNTFRKEHDQIAVLNTLGKTQMATTSTIRREAAQIDRHLEKLGLDTTGDSQATSQILQRNNAGLLTIARMLKHQNELRANAADQETVLNMARTNARTEALNINAAWGASWDHQQAEIESGLADQAPAE